ncbi:MAG: hypothetical protein LKK08_06175 [Bacteroidales bacterium]|jgi:hypothetical protein|nr:hypothetical protein [Bacteroidales bacterium]
MDSKTFLDAVSEMRNAQKEYFRRHDYMVLLKCKKLEKKVDELLKGFTATDRKKEDRTLFNQ